MRLMGQGGWFQGRGKAKDSVELKHTHLAYSRCTYILLLCDGSITHVRSLKGVIVKL